MTEPVGDPVVDPPADPPADPQADRTFTPADVERIVKDRLARHKTEPPSDYAELQAAAVKLAEIEAANKTEIEKERDRATAAEERATKIEAEGKEIRLRSSLLAEAAKSDRNVVDAEAAIALLDRSTLTLDDQGHPTNVAEAMDSLLKAKPFLVSAGGTRGSADQGARSGAPNQVSEAALDDMTAEQIVAARKAGRLTGLGVAP